MIKIMFTLILLATQIGAADMKTQIIDRGPIHLEYFYSKEGDSLYIDVEKSLYDTSTLFDSLTVFSRGVTNYPYHIKDYELLSFLALLCHEFNHITSTDTTYSRFSSFYLEVAISENVMGDVNKIIRSFRNQYKDCKTIFLKTQNLLLTNTIEKNQSSQDVLHLLKTQNINTKILQFDHLTGLFVEKNITPTH